MYSRSRDHPPEIDDQILTQPAIPTLSLRFFMYHMVAQLCLWAVLADGGSRGSLQRRTLADPV